MKARSPKYPNIALPDALDKARDIYIKEHQNPMDGEIIAQHMGYTGISGASLRAISALRQYGFLEGRAANSHISDDAVTIFADEETGSLERADALRRSVENPPLFQEVMAAFQQTPSQANLRSFLQKRKFTRKAADKAAVIYRASVEFVDQETSDYNSNVAELPEPKTVSGFTFKPKIAAPGFSEYPERAVGQVGRENQGLSEIEYIRVSKQTGIRILADGPYSAEDIEAVVDRLSAGLKRGLYDDLEESELDDEASSGS